MAIQNSSIDIPSVNADGLMNSSNIISSIFFIPKVKKSNNINSRIINNNELASDHLVQQVMFFILMAFAIIFLIYFLYITIMNPPFMHNYNLLCIGVIILFIELINIAFVKKNFYATKNIIDHTSNLEKEIASLLNKNRKNNEPIILIKKDEVSYNVDLLKINYITIDNKYYGDIFLDNVKIDLTKFNKVIMENSQNKIYGFQDNFLILYEDILVLLYYNNDVIIFDHMGKKYKINTLSGEVYINNPTKIIYNNRNIRCINTTNTIDFKNLLDNLWQYTNPQGEQIIFNNI